MKRADGEQGRAASPQAKASAPLRVADAGTSADAPKATALEPVAPPPSQWGVGRPRVPPALNKDGRRRAGDYVLGAVRIKAEATTKSGDLLNGPDHRHADNWMESAFAPLEQSEQIIGGELMPVLEDRDWDTALGAIKNTVEMPTYVTADASRDRIQLAHDAGVLEVGLDLADTVQAQNSLERMLSHQMAAAHRASMKVAEQLNRCVERMDNPYDPEAQERANRQGTRLAGAMARMQASFQQGALTLHKLRTGGRQVVTVQHVQVNDGGQAVVAGQIGGGGKQTSGGQSEND